MRRGTRSILLAGVLGVACGFAVHASATGAPAVFRLTISGTATADWDHTGAPATGNVCDVSVRSEGVRTARFRSSRPTVVRFVGGRIQTVELRAAAGAVTLTGRNTANEVCGQLEKHTVQPCAKTTRTFKDARATLLSTKPGSITVRPLHVPLRRIECPQEPDEVYALPLGPAPGPLHISLSLLADKRIARITLTASTSRRKKYASPESGTLRQRTAWKITLVRIHCGAACGAAISRKDRSSPRRGSRLGL